MTKILVDVDDQALADAAQVLGTTTKKDTVNAALREVSRRRDRAAALARLRELVRDGQLELLPHKRNHSPGPGQADE